MPPSVLQKHSNESLETEALNLLQAHRRTPDAETATALSSFRNLSRAHEAAVRQAEQFLALSKQITRPEQNRSRSLARWLELSIIRCSENPTAIGASTAVVAGAVAFWILANQTEEMPPPAAVVETVVPEAVQTFSTRWGEQDEIVLDDGSTVWLGWRSTIEVELTEVQREVTLQSGIAAFKVVSDPEREFIVNTDSVQTTVTGTEFVVDRQQAGDIEVAVLKGQVVVSGPAATQATLNATQTVSVSNGQMSDISNRLPDQIGQWRNGMLVFDDRPLIDALEEIEPYTRWDLDMTRIEGYQGRVSGVFFINQAEDALVTILQTHRLETDNRGRNTLHIRFARPQRPL